MALWFFIIFTINNKARIKYFLNEVSDQHSITTHYHPAWTLSVHLQFMFAEDLFHKQQNELQPLVKDQSLQKARKQEIIFSQHTPQEEVCD